MHTATKKTLLIVILANLIAALLYGFLLWKIQSIEQQGVAFETTINQAEQRNNELSSLQKLVTDTATDRASLQSLFLNNSNQVAFIEQVETLAKQSGLSETTTGVSTVPDHVATVHDLQLSLETTGNYRDTFYFLNQLENLPYNLRITSMSLIQQNISDDPTKPQNTTSGWRNQLVFTVTEDN